MDNITTIEQFTQLIQQWYQDDHQGFQTKYTAAVSNVQDIPPGQDPAVVHDWINASIDDLCSFFTEWYHWTPSVNTGLEYIQRFSWLYYENQQGLEFVTTSPGFDMTKIFVELRGQYMDSPDSKPLVEKWMTQLGPKQMEEYIIPPVGFQNYNEFFIKEVKPGQRPITKPYDSTAIVAPADCVINMIVDNLTLDSQIPVKTVNLNIRQLLNQSPHAEKFVGGTAVSCILMPNTYHRYHAPVAGKVIESNSDVAGEYFGIKDFPDLLNKGDVGYGYDYSVFEHFRRGYFIIETENYGLVGMVPVGLNTIASVIFHDQFNNITSGSEPAPVEKGQELGYFQYGGSLNILIFEPGRFPSMSLSQGQQIGVFNTNCTVQANQAWQNSGITIQSNNATSIRYIGGQWTANPSTGMVDAAGNSNYTAKPGYTLPGYNEGALCAKVGESGTPFLVGDGAQIPSGQSGEIYFCINDDLTGEYGAGLTDNVGAVTVTIEID